MTAENKIPLIYRFPNATVVRWRGPRPSGTLSLASSGVELATASAISKDTQDKLVGYGTNGLNFYEASSGKLTLEASTWSQNTISYIPKDAANDQLRKLTEESYEKLTPNFKHFYTKELSEPIETRVTIDFELMVMDFELDEEVILGKEHLTELHKSVYELRRREAQRNRSYYGSNSDTPFPSFERTLPVKISSEELMKLVELAESKIANGSGYAATVSFFKPYNGLPELTVNFLEKPYDGSTEKILAKKQNGQPYADRRGRFVRSMPRTVGKAKISTLELGSWWDSIGGNDLSDVEKAATIEALTRSLWKI